MPEPGEQLTLKQALEQVDVLGNHPAFQGVERDIAAVNPSTQNPQGYTPINLPNDASANQFMQQHSPPDPNLQQPAPLETEQTQLPPRDDQGRFTKLYAGKYANPLDLENAFMGKVAEAQRYRDELEALKAAHSLVSSQPQQFTSRQERQSPIPVQQDASANLYVAPDQINNLIQQQAAEIARNEIHQFMQPILKGNQAITQLRTTYPEYTQNEPDFSKWLSVNPELSRRISASTDSDLLMEGAYLKFRTEKASALSQTQQTASQQSQPQLQQARQHAGPTSGVRNQVPEDVSRERQLFQLRQLMDSSDPNTRKRAEQAYARLRLEEANVTSHVEGMWGR